MEHKFYCACMLMLLKPWTRLRDIKGQHATFKSAFDEMVAQGNRFLHTFLHNIQYYHECSDRAKARREEEKKGTHKKPESTELVVDEEEMAILREEFDKADRISQDVEEDITKEDIERARNMKTPMREKLFGVSAIAGAYDYGFFTKANLDNDRTWIIDNKADSEDMQKISLWVKQLKETTRMAKENTPVHQEVGPSIIQGDHMAPIQLIGPSIAPLASLSTNNHPNRLCEKLAMLNTEQKRAHDIIEEKIKAVLGSK